MIDSKAFPVGCVVMAAGNAERFGRNKLLADVDGKSMLMRALEAVPADRLSCVVVVTQYKEAEALARSFGFHCVRNEHPELGQSLSVRLGTEALRDSCRAIIYQVADQPLLRRQSVAALADLCRVNPDRIVALSHGGVRGNPCAFPREFFPELCALTGDRGGSAVIRRHEDRLLLLEVGEAELADVDTPEALRKLKTITETDRP